MQAGGILTLFFAWNGSQTFEELGSVMIHRVEETHPLLGRALTIVHSVFSIMAGLFVEMFFMLFSVYNGLKMSEYEVYWQQIFH